MGFDHQTAGWSKIQLFDKDTDGSKPKSHYIMGRRNWCCITLKQPSNDLLFDIRVEKEKGHGDTVGYVIHPLTHPLSVRRLNLTFPLAGIL